MAYPSDNTAIPAYAGTSLQGDIDHAGWHGTTNTDLDGVKTVLGTTAGTSIVKDVLKGQFVATTEGTETLTNKTITLPAIDTGFTGTGKATGAEINTGTEDAKIVTPKAIADSKVSITDGTETLTNKTLILPIITGEKLMVSGATWFRKIYYAAIVGWTSIVSFNPEGASQYSYSEVVVTAMGRVNSTGQTGFKVSRWYIENQNGTVYVAQVGSDVDSGAPPDIQLTVASDIAYIQVKSNHVTNSSYTSICVDAKLHSGFAGGNTWIITDI